MSDMRLPMAAMARYLVKIIFTDGQSAANVTAASEQRAYSLALIDARMGNPSGTFYGKAISHTVELAQLERMTI